MLTTFFLISSNRTSFSEIKLKNNNNNKICHSERNDDTEFIGEIMFPGFTVKDKHLLEYILIPVSHDFSGNLYNPILFYRMHLGKSSVFL